MSRDLGRSRTKLLPQTRWSVSKKECVSVCFAMVVLTTITCIAQHCCSHHQKYRIAQKRNRKVRFIFFTRAASLIGHILHPKPSSKSPPIFKAEPQKNALPPSCTQSSSRRVEMPRSRGQKHAYQRKRGLPTPKLSPRRSESRVTASYTLFTYS